MKIETLQSITDATTALAVFAKIKSRYARRIKYGKKMLTIDDVLKQYDPNQHDVHDRAKRKDKKIEVPGPNWTEQNPEMVPEWVRVCRTSVNDQQLIVSRAVAFLTGNPIDFIADPQNDLEKNLLAAVRRVYENNKMDYKKTQLATKQKSETHAALVWYIVDNSENQNADDDFEGININTRGLTLRCKVLAKSLGYDLYPVWDNTGNMIGFLSEYTDVDDDNNKERHSELYMDDRTIFVTITGKGSPMYDEKANPIGKNPVIYFPQDEPEWLPVQPAITRRETSISNTGDTNDYYASPTTVVSGDVVGFNKKGETGKILEVGRDAQVSLLEAKNGVESVKFEHDELKQIILTGTQTPDISFESMKSLGTFSGIALKMLFFDASLKVRNAMPTYGDSMQRSINYVKAALAKFDISFKPAARMVIKPKIEPYMPSDVAEMIDILNIATGDQAVMSRETAIRHNPLVEKPDQELELIKVDDKRRLELAKPAAAPVKPTLPVAA